VDPGLSGCLTEKTLKNGKMRPKEKAHRHKTVAMCFLYIMQ
jgi:hypothetical protein